jgi:hypothetical protein
MSDAILRLEGLSRGFRGSFLDYETLTAQLKTWAEAYPTLVRLESLGATPDRREIWLLTVGADPERVRPAVWVDGNMHASEVCGSSAALAIAEDVLRLHLAPDAALHFMKPRVREALRDVLFYVLPRMSPDGAEEVLKKGRYVRSVPRDVRPNRQKPRWRVADVDGDGLAFLMRVVDVTGEYVESAEHPGLMLPRTIDDDGPFYKLYPEGFVDGFDGDHVPDPTFLDDNEPDLNRNFPWSWAPEPEQVGAGRYPGSEPESRAVIDFATRHPEICCWLNFHTFGGVFIRPRGDAPDTKMDPQDLALYRQLGVWAEELAGYPMVSGYEEFTYSPETPIKGDLSEWAYGHRGTVAYVCELWDLFHELELERPKRFVEHYTRLSRADLVRFARWDAETNHGRVLRPWRSVKHPQLGEVEVGGFDPRVGVWNPPLERVADVCQKQASMWLRVASLVPHVVVEEVEQRAVDGGTHVVRVAVKNTGYLPTYVLSSAKALPHNEALWAEASASGCELVGHARVEVGHLEGWGRGIHDGSAAVHYMRSQGSRATRILSFTVRGSGTLSLRVGSCRVGWTETTIDVH